MLVDARDLRRQIVDRGHRRAGLAVDVAGSLLDPNGVLLELLSCISRRRDHVLPARLIVRVDGQLRNAVEEGGERSGNAGLSTSIEQRLDLTQVGRLLLRRSKLLGLVTHRLIEIRRAGADEQAGDHSALGDRRRRQRQIVADVARRVRVGHVILDDVENLVVDLERARRIQQSRGQASHAITPRSSDSIRLQRRGFPEAT